MVDRNHILLLVSKEAATTKGYIGANGAMDMNIVIRTAVVTPLPHVASWQVSVGAGGAITILSESEDEYDEMSLKARAVVNAVQAWAATPFPDTDKSALQNATVALSSAEERDL